DLCTARLRHTSHTIPLALKGRNCRESTNLYGDDEGNSTRLVPVVQVSPTLPLLLLAGLISVSENYYLQPAQPLVMSL
uniref:Uncharacterized protein n=1 Tax=Aegilops tauschii subsp. strangulata TaxID=200361 RepID=A0A453AD61_AEGTS